MDNNILQFPIRNIRPPQVAPAARKCLRDDGTPVKTGDRVVMFGTDDFEYGWIEQTGVVLGGWQSYAVRRVSDGICIPASAEFMAFVPARSEQFRNFLPQRLQQDIHRHQ